MVQLHYLSVETWRCPHCGTTQADGSRCWACSRHPLVCGTCRNYVRAVAGRLGYCALDRTRAVLQGDEIRACWQAPSRPERFEGLFRDVVTEPAVPGDEPGVTDETRTRTWAIPVMRTSDPLRTSDTQGGAGLVDAPYVPARSVMRPRPGPDDSRVGDIALDGVSGWPSADLEVRGVGEDPAVGERDPDAHEAVPGLGIPRDPDT
jgi:hypothetical protein